MRYFLLLLALSLAGCGKGKKDVVAKVDGEVLTVDMLFQYAPRDQWKSLTPEEREDLINRWIEQSLFYIDAKKMGLDKDPMIEAQVRDYRKKLVIDRYFQEVLGMGNVMVTEEDVKNYYDSHLDEYREERKIMYAVYPTKEIAQEAMRRMEEGDKDVIQQFQTLTLKRGEFQIPEVEEAAFTTPQGKTAGPIETMHGYFVVKVLSVKKLKKPQEFDDVKRGIWNYLMNRRRMEIYNAKVQELKEKYKYFINMEPFERALGEIP